MASGETADVLGKVRGRVEHGESLAGAMASHPDFFFPTYVGLIRRR